MVKLLFLLFLSLTSIAYSVDYLREVWRVQDLRLTKPINENGKYFYFVYADNGDIKLAKMDTNKNILRQVSLPDINFDTDWTDKYIKVDNGVLYFIGYVFNNEPQDSVGVFTKIDTNQNPPTKTQFFSLPYKYIGGRFFYGLAYWPYILGAKLSDGFLIVGTADNDNLINGCPKKRPYTYGQIYDSSGFNKINTYDIVLIKTDLNGNCQWYTYFGSQYDEVGVDLAVDENGNIYVLAVAGAFVKDGSPSNPTICLSNPNYSIPNAPNQKNPYKSCLANLIVKFDKNGNYLWHTFWGYKAFPQRIVYYNGNIYISGQTRDTGYRNNDDSFPAKKVLWDLPLDKVRGRAVGEDNGYILSLTSNGDLRWGRVIETVGGPYFANYGELVVNESGIFVGTVKHLTSFGSISFYIQTFDFDGYLKREIYTEISDVQYLGWLYITSAQGGVLLGHKPTIGGNNNDAYLIYYQHTIKPSYTLNINVTGNGKVRIIVYGEEGREEGEVTKDYYCTSSCSETIREAYTDIVFIPEPGSGAVFEGVRGCSIWKDQQGNPFIYIVDDTNCTFVFSSSGSNNPVPPPSDGNNPVPPSNNGGSGSSGGGGGGGCSMGYGASPINMLAWLLLPAFVFMRRYFRLHF